MIIRVIRGSHSLFKRRKRHGRRDGVFRFAGEGGGGEAALEADADRFVAQQRFDHGRGQGIARAGRIDEVGRPGGLIQAAFFVGVGQAARAEGDHRPPHTLLHQNQRRRDQLGRAVHFDLRQRLRFEMIARDQIQPIEQRLEPRRQRHRAGIAVEERLVRQHLAQAQQHIGRQAAIADDGRARLRSVLAVDRDRRVAAHRGCRR